MEAPVCCLSLERFGTQSLTLSAWVFPFVACLWREAASSLFVVFEFYVFCVVLPFGCLLLERTGKSSSSRSTRVCHLLHGSGEDWKIYFVAIPCLFLLLRVLGGSVRGLSGLGSRSRRKDFSET